MECNKIKKPLSIEGLSIDRNTKQRFNYFLVESFLVESITNLVVSFLVESTTGATLVESTLVESAAGALAPPLPQAANTTATERIAKTFFM